MLWYSSKPCCAPGRYPEQGGQAGSSAQPQHTEIKPLQMMLQEQLSTAMPPLAYAAPAMEMKAEVRAAFCGHHAEEEENSHCHIPLSGLTVYQG